MKCTPRGFTTTSRAPYDRGWEPRVRCATISLLLCGLSFHSRRACGDRTSVWCCRRPPLGCSSKASPCSTVSAHYSWHPPPQIKRVPPVARRACAQVQKVSTRPGWGPRCILYARIRNGGRRGGFNISFGWISGRVRETLLGGGVAHSSGDMPASQLLPALLLCPPTPPPPDPPPSLCVLAPISSLSQPPLPRTGRPFPAITQALSPPWPQRKTDLRGGETV